MYRATDTRLHREVAIKVSSECFSDRFEREAHAVAALNHPNICTLHDVGPNYLVMELIDGQGLDERIQHGPLPLGEALRIAIQIAEALEAAHEKGIVHRDLKPSNVKIKADGTVKVLDFGVAQFGLTTMDGAATFAADATKQGMIVGTAPYMSPEQTRGTGVDKRADIWAYGCVVFEMLTGHRAFGGTTLADVFAEVVKAEPDWNALPPQTPSIVRSLLRRCLEKEPSRSPPRRRRRADRDPRGAVRAEHLRTADVKAVRHHEMETRRTVDNRGRINGGAPCNAGCATPQPSASSTGGAAAADPPSRGGALPRTCRGCVLARWSSRRLRGHRSRQPPTLPPSSR